MVFKARNAANKSMPRPSCGAQYSVQHSPICNNVATKQEASVYSCLHPAHQHNVQQRRMWLHDGPDTVWCLAVHHWVKARRRRPTEGIINSSVGDVSIGLVLEGLDVSRSGLHRVSALQQLPSSQVVS